VEFPVRRSCSYSIIWIIRRTSSTNPTTVDDKLEQRCGRIIVSLKEILKEPDKPLTKQLARLFSIDKGTFELAGTFSESMLDDAIDFSDDLSCILRNCPDHSVEKTSLGEKLEKIENGDSKKRKIKSGGGMGCEKRRKCEIGCAQKNREGFEIRMKLRKVGWVQSERTNRFW